MSILAPHCGICGSPLLVDVNGGGFCPICNPDPLGRGRTMCPHCRGAMVVDAHATLYCPTCYPEHPIRVDVADAMAKEVDRMIMASCTTSCETCMCRLVCRWAEDICAIAADIAVYKRRPLDPPGEEYELTLTGAEYRGHLRKLARTLAGLCGHYERMKPPGGAVEREVD